MDLARRQLGGGGLLDPEGVPGLAVGQLAHADRLAAAGNVGLDEIVVELAVGRRHAIAERGHGGRAQTLLIGRRDRVGKLPEGTQHRALERLLDQQVPHLLRHVAHGDPGWRDAGLEALGQPLQGLLDQRRHLLEPRQDVLVVAERPRRHDGQHLGDVLLHAAHLVDGQVLAGEALGLYTVLELLDEQVVVQPVDAGELGAGDRAQHLQAADGVGVAPPGCCQRVVGPAVVAGGVADVGRELGELEHRVVEVELDVGGQALARREAFRVGLDDRHALHQSPALGLVVESGGAAGGKDDRQRQATDRESAHGYDLLRNGPPSGGDVGPRWRRRPRTGAHRVPEYTQPAAPGPRLSAPAPTRAGPPQGTRAAKAPRPARAALVGGLRPPRGCI